MIKTFDHPTKQVFFDLDGTLLQPTPRTLGLYRQNYFVLSSQRVKDRFTIKTPTNQLIHAMNRAAHHISQNPGSNPWIMDDKPVSSANDELVLCTVAAQKVLATEKNVDKTILRELLQIVYGECYKGLSFELCSGTYDLLEHLHRQHIPYHVITNSAAHEANKNLARLLPRHLWHERLITGHAKKYLVGNSVGSLPETIPLPGSPYPAYLWRTEYYNRLQDLLSKSGIPDHQTLIVGDNALLDLVMPLGRPEIDSSPRFQGALVKHHYTAPYEHAYIATHPNGRVISNLRELIHLW